MSSTSLNILYHPSLFFNGQRSPKSDPGSFCNFLDILHIPYNLNLYKKQTAGILYCNFTYSTGMSNKDLEIAKFKDILAKTAKTKIKLLLWQPYENFGYLNPQFKHKWITNLQILQEAGFPLERVFYVSGDLLCNQTDNLEYNKINRIGVDAFPFVTAQRYSRLKKRPIQSTNKTKKFLCLNALPRAHRSALYYYLTKNNLIDENIVSWNQEYKKLSAADANLFNFDNSNICKVKTLPTIKLQNDEGPNKGFQNLSWYDNTVFSLVTETTVEKDTLFLTEKIYKPIMIGHPFVVWGNPGTLEFLKSEGYQTFPELFDESYDLEKDTAKRLQKIIDICKTCKLEDWSEEVIEKINFNKQLFEKNWRFKFTNFTKTVVTALTSNENV